MSKEASSDLAHFRIISDDVFLEVGEKSSCEPVDVFDVAEYRQ